MDKFDAFFEPAKKVSLSETELSSCRNQLMQKMQENPVRDANGACPTEYMTDFDPSLVRSAHTVRLTTTEAEAAEKALLAFIKDHPVDMAAAVRQRERKESSGSFFSLFSFRYSPALAAVLILVLGTGSLSYAAESALPGETLYSVKIHVNEKVQTALAVTPEAKAYWEAKRAERRVKEAKRLADAGRLTPETNDTLIVAFNAHIENSHTNIRKVADRGRRERAEEITKKTEVALRSQAETLRDNKAIAMMYESVERAAERTVLLDSSIHNQIAINTPPTDPSAMSMMMVSDTEVTTASSASSERGPIAINIRVDAEQRGKELPEAGIVDMAKVRIEGDADMSISSDSSVTLLQKSFLTKQGASSSVTSGSGSSSQKNSASSVTVRSATSASIDIHVSSRSGTPLHIDIQTDGSIEVDIVTPEKPKLLP